jgi:flagellar basal-body rod protein FlgG
MLRSLTTAATGMQAQQQNMDTIANNLANVSTTGFKRSRAEFEDLLYQTQKEPGAASGLNAVSPTGVQTGLGVKTASIQKDFELGAAKVTNNPLDMMVEGAGFFPLQMADGSTGYTRDGAFKKNPQGTIVDKNGNSLIPQITIPQDATAIDVGADGKVSVVIGGNREPQSLGQINLVNFINPAGLKALGKNVYAPSASSGQPQQGTPGQQGFGQIASQQLEGSNVNIVDEMVNMITAQRSYETNSKVIQASDQMLQYMNQLK